MSNQNLNSNDINNPNFMFREHDACGIGAVVNINGKPDHNVLSDAISIVEKLEHRAGKDATGKVGDGVGILTQISHKFFKKAAKKEGIPIGDAGDYGIGMYFLPADPMKQMFAKRMLEVITEKNLKVVYQVDSKVIEDEGRPHVILRDAVPMGED